jgi:plasmid maintenance system antidote protein VapI
VLRLVIEGLHITQEEAAARLGVEAYQLKRYIGSVNKPNIEMAYEIEVVFGVSPRLWTIPIDEE